MRDIIDLLDSLTESTVPKLRQDIVSTVKQTDDQRLLSKVLDTLKAGDIDTRIETILDRDPDAKKFIPQIADLIIKTPAPLEEKDQFLKRYPRGILDAKKLLSGRQHTFAELVGAGFPTQIFKAMSTQLVSQGVGPGEVALAVLSPEITWSGRAAGGGDILVGDRAVEVKTSVASGGRWINARKADMDMPKIQRAIAAGIQATAAEKKQDIEMPAIPARTSVNYWVDTLRPLISKTHLGNVAQEMADGLFSHTDNTKYRQALISGTAQEITDALLDTGYENYKAYSGFDGMLLMDIPTETAQYFRSYASMRGKIKNETPYVFGPEAEAMPKVSLLSAAAAEKRGKNPNARKDSAAKSTKVTDNPRVRAALPRAGSNTALGRKKK